MLSRQLDRNLEFNGGGPVYQAGDADKLGNHQDINGIFQP